MEIDWDWKTKYFVGAVHEPPAYAQMCFFEERFCFPEDRNKEYFKKEGDYYELWKIWRTICIIRIKSEIK